jgi:TP901 family phage tail tape measure protein
MSVIASLVVRVSANLAEVEESFSKLERGALRVQKTYERMGAQLQSIGGKLTTGLTLPIVGFAAVATKSFADFEGAMKGVEAALGPTAAELDALQAAALEWGARTKFSATEAAEALGELGKAGFTAQQSIAALPATLQLATVAGMGLADSATLMSDTLSQFGLSVEHAARVNDVLVAAAQASTIDVEQLGQAFKYAGPVAAAFGMSLEDTAAAVAMFGKVGIKADMAGTALRNILTDVINPTKGMSDVMKELGIRTLETSPGVVKLTDVINKLKESGATSAQVMQAFGDRAGPVMVSLVSQGTAELKKLEAGMQSSAGAAQKAADTMMKGMGGAVEQMRGALESAGISIGSILAPAITAVASKVAELADWVSRVLVPAFKELPGWVQVSIGGFVGLAAAIGPLVYVAGTMVASFGSLAGLFGKTAGAAGDAAGGLSALTKGLTLQSIATAATTAATWLLNTALAVLTSPITAVVLAIGAVVLAIRYFTGSWEGVLKVLTLGFVDFQTLNKIWEYTKTAAAAVGQAFVALGTAIKAGFGAALQWITPYITVFLGTLQNAHSSITAAIGSVWERFKAVLQSVADSGIGQLVIAIGGLIARIGGWAFITAGRAYWDTLQLQIKGVGVVVGWLGDVTRGFVAGAWSLLRGAIDLGRQAWQAFRNYIADKVGPILDWIGEKVKAIGATIDSWARTAAEKIRWVAGLLPGIKLPDLGAGIKQTGAAAAGAVPSVGALGNAATVLAGAFHTGLSAPVLAGVSKGITGVGKAAKEARDEVGELARKLLGADILTDANKYMDALKRLPAGIKLTAEASRDLNTKLSEALDVYTALGQKAPAAMIKVWAATIPPPEISRLTDVLTDLGVFKDSVESISLMPGLTDVGTVLKDLPWQTMPDLTKVLRLDALKAELTAFAKGMQDAIGDVVGAFATGAADIGDIWRTLWGGLQDYAGSVIKSMVKGLLDGLAKAITSGQKLDWGSIFGGGGGALKGGLIGGAVGGAVGFGVGAKYGKGKGALAGAGAGAATGFMVGGPWGAAIGGAVGLIGGLFGGSKKKKEEQEYLSSQRAELIKNHGSMEKLRETASRLGVDIDKAFSTKKPKEFDSLVGKLNEKLEKETKLVAELTAGLDAAAKSGGLLSKALIQGIKTAPPAAKDTIFGFYEDQTKQTIDNLTKYLEAGSIRTQAGATAIAASIAGVYEDLRDQGYTTRQAFLALEPAITKFTQQTAAAGYVGTAAMAELQTLAALAADEIAGPAFDAVESLGAVMGTLFNTGRLTQEVYAGLAAEISATYSALEAQGKGGEAAIRGMQPTLQRMWELQQDFGYEVDESTQKLLDFASQSGIIGDKFRPAADRMAASIDKLIERFDAFLSKLTNETASATAAAVNTIERTIGAATIPPVVIPYLYEPQNQMNIPGGGEYPALADGAIVRRPTVALVGEAGPEAVIPLSADFISGGDQTTEIYLDSDLIARKVLKREPGILRAYGAAR